MLQSIKQLEGNALGASDGEIGHVKDFYFDDQKWAIRYVVVETGSWLAGRAVLISPHAFGRLHQAEKVLRVKLTRKQIENSPSIDSHKPVSRQYEEEYYRYYGWPSYWDDGGTLGAEDFPSAPQPQLILDEQASLGNGSRNGNDPHLRSTLSLIGYHIQAKDDEIGHVTDFIMDDQNWAICSLIVKTGHWFSAREIAISPNHIDRISYEESTVVVKLTKEAIQAGPEYHSPPQGVAGNGSER